jgi:glutathione S-transferase
MDKIDKALQTMNKGLGDKAYCSGVHFSLSDVAVGCALEYLDFRFPQIEWRNDHPKLAKLQEKLAQRPSFAETRAG